VDKDHAAGQSIGFAQHSPVKCGIALKARVPFGAERVIGRPQGARATRANGERGAISPPGSSKRVGIVGHNAAGKTTLLNLLTGKQERDSDARWCMIATETR
jgi:translation initiation factor RLI1